VGSVTAAWARAFSRRARNLGTVARHAVQRGMVWGWCPICARRTLFYHQGPWPRDQFRCARCLSIPRWRALVRVLETHFPGWRQLAIHESSPGGSGSAKLARECRGYMPTHYFPDVSPGQSRNAVRCENLEAQTFADEQFDLVITQDVFEHLLNPRLGFAEIARTLRPGGAHLFTVPWYWWKPTLTRAKLRDSQVVHLEPPEYHGNPISADGSLVVTEWGWDLCDFIYRSAGLTTTVILIVDRRQGIEAEFNEVFISRKPR